MNRDVDFINDVVLTRCPGDLEAYASADVVGEEHALAIPSEYLNTLSGAARPPHLLRLKPGVPLMLLRNIDPAGGLCNGTRLIFTKAHGGWLLEAVVATGKRAGDTVFVPRMKLFPTDGEFPFDWSRRQFPVKLAFAMTINKSQGQTLRRVVVYLRSSVFAHGQLYVAVSRVSGPECISFALPPGASGVRNVVYREALV